MGERLLCKEEVKGSSPFISTERAVGRAEAEEKTQRREDAKKRKGRRRFSETEGAPERRLRKILRRRLQWATEQDRIPTLVVSNRDSDKTT
jgi:hypothetical protein